MSKFDLANLDTVKGANEGFDVELLHPGTNDSLGIIFTVLGKDSDKFQGISTAQNKKRIDRMNKNGFRPQKSSSSLDGIAEDSLDLLAACTTGWRTVEQTELDKKTRKEVVVSEEKNTITIDKKELPFSVDNSRKIYVRFPWIKELIDKEIGDRANFIKA